MLRPGFLTVAAVALISLGSWSPAAAQQTCTVEFNEVGEHSFTVPNVDEITVDVFGASGGDTIPPVDPPGFPGLGAAALGAALPVSPGEILTVRVGGRGEDTIAQAGTGPGAAGGFNGGGDGGDKTSGSGTAHTGAGGGGASDVLRGTDRLVIAGGGGGGAHSGLGGHGGEDGNDGTSDGDFPDSFGRSGGNGGAGGPGSGPGSEGETSDPTSGVGGKGGGGVDAGSGGGGGLRGGGGGGGGALGNGAGGGGGSSFGPAGTTFETGANEGDGRVEIHYQCQSGISIVKTGSGPDPLVEGETVDYSFEVTNTGNVPLTEVTVTDPLDGLSPIDCPGDTLDPGESMTCTATYVVTQTDVEAGVIENTATATGQPPPDTNLPPPTDDDTTTVPPTQNPDIEIVKSGSGPDPLVLGVTVDYTFEVTNTGNVTLTDVTVTDPLPGLSPIDCPESSLTPGESMTCNASYEVTQTDVDAGVIENTATVTGQPPAGPPPTDESTTTVPPAGTPGISIEKSGSGPDPLEVGATIDYTFVVTNTGNVTLNDVTITDPLPGLSPIECPGTTLAPGAEMTCTATYEVTQADAEAEVIENTATVTGETPTGGPPPTDESTTTVPPAEPVPALPPLAFVLLVALLTTATLWTLRRARV